MCARAGIKPSDGRSSFPRMASARRRPVRDTSGRGARDATRLPSPLRIRPRKRRQVEARLRRGRSGRLAELGRERLYTDIGGAVIGLGGAAALLNFVLLKYPLLRRHADRAVEADRLAVQHLVLDDREREVRELVRDAEPRGERDAGAQRLAVLLGERRQKRRVEEARRDRVDADAAAGEVAGGRKGEADDAGLRRRVGGLADLPVEGGDRRRVDADAPLAVWRPARSRTSRSPRGAAR